MSYDPYYADETYEPTAPDPYSALTPEQQMWAMQELLMGGGVAPQGMTGIAGLPQLSTKGVPQPYDLGLAQQQLNFGQDVGSSMTNPFMQYMGGPGAYAPGALDPTFDDKPMQFTQGPQLNYLAATGGIQGTLADLILGGMNPLQAAARVRSMIERPDEYGVSEEEATALRGELPQTQGQFMGAKPEPDWNSLNKIADDLGKPFLSEQAMMQQPDMTQLPDGRWVQRTQVDSPQMEFLKKMGLPDPRAQYDLQYALENDPTLSSLLQRSAASQQERDMMRTELEDRLKRIKKRREQGDSDGQQMEKFATATKQAMADFFSQSARNTPAPPAPVPNRMGFEANSGLGGAFSYAPGDANAPSFGGFVNTQPAGRRLEPDLPARPKLGPQYSMMETMLGKPIMDRRQQALDEAIPERARTIQRMAKERKLQGVGTQAAWEYAMQLAPVIAAGRRGETPASSAIQQRLAPLYAMGAIRPR
jgi:hypothetical protein